MGMLAGTLVVSRISSQWATWVAMIILLAVHLGTNYLAVRAVAMRTLNRQRANILFSDCLDQLSATEKPATQVSKLKILTPEQVSLQEKIFERDGVLRWRGGSAIGYGRLGVPFRTLLDQFHPRDSSSGSYKRVSTSNIKLVMDLYRSQGYILWYDRKHTTFLIVLKEQSDIHDQLRAWMHALYAAREVTPSHDDESLLEIFRHTMDFIGQLLNTDGGHGNNLFNLLEENGWDITTGAMETTPGTRVELLKT